MEQGIVTTLGGRLRAMLIVFSVITFLLTGLGAAHAAEPGDIVTFAQVPATPGYPEGIAVHGTWVFVSGPFGDIPDQLAFGARGDLYVSLAFSNQISVLSPNGTEKTRFGSAPDDTIPLDSPAGIAFDASSKSLLIANHALLSENAANFAVLKLYVKDPGNELVKP